MNKPYKWYVYIVECKDGLYYTGTTWNLDTRIEQHAIGKGSKFTSKHGFKELKWYQEFDDINQARECEIKVKDYSRKKKEELWSSEV